MSSCFKNSLRPMAVVFTFSKSIQIRKITQTVSARNLAIPQPDGQPKVFSSKIENIANSIAQLNLVEVSELSDLLKKKLNLPDVPAMSFANVSAEPGKEEEEQPQHIQTLFTVKLLKYDEKQKIALIKEIKSIMDDMNLVQAKKFVESTPVIVKQDLGKTEAEKLKEALSKVGGEVEIA